MDPSFTDRLRRAVLRVYPAEDSANLYGTAFGISDYWALTCAHVVLSKPAGYSLRLFGAQGELGVVKTVIHPDHENCDLALLRVDKPLSEPLACSKLSTPMTSPLSRGYSAADTGWGGQELRFTPRGLTNIIYPGPFSIYDAFDLTGDMAAPGFSGSPLLDPQTGAVMGVISSGSLKRGRSWAVPLAAAGEWRQFQEALAWNDQHLARFGQMVNYPGAMEVCRIQSSRAIHDLRLSQKFVKEWDVRRTGMAEIVARFRKAEAPVLSIVGRANVGKTWLLCHLASDAAMQPHLLLRAAALINRQPVPLDKFVEESLVDAWRSSGGDPTVAMPSMPALAKACADADRPLLILLDGINEAIHVPGFLLNWLPYAVGFCAERRSKLVITSREEMWPSVARAIPCPRAKLFAATPSESRPGAPPADIPIEDRYIRLADFNQEEAATARKVYGVPVRTDYGIGHHPLLFRVARVLAIDSVASSVGRYELLQSFVSHQLDEILSHIQGVSTRSLLARLQSAASALTPGLSSGLEWTHASDLLGGDAAINALLDVGLLITTGNSVRFAYDQVADILRPSHHNPVDLFCTLRADIPISADVLENACTTILRFEADGDENGFRLGFDALLQALATLSGGPGALATGKGNAESGELDWDLDRIRLFNDFLLPLILNALRTGLWLPRSRIVEIEQLYRSILGYCHFISHPGTMSFGMLGRWLEEAPLPAALRARFLLEAAPWDDAWPWRFTDWMDTDNFLLAMDEASSGRSGAVLSRLLREDAAGVRSILIAGLQDSTKIGYGRSNMDRGRATISSLCAGVLFHRRTDDPDGLYSALLKVKDDTVPLLLGRLVALDPIRMATLAVAQLRRIPQGCIAIEVLAAAASALDRETRTAAAAALEPFLTETNPADAVRAAKAIRRLNRDHEESWDYLVRHLDEPDCWITSLSLSSVPATRFPALVELIRRNPDLGFDLMAEDDGPRESQQAMAAIASEQFVVVGERSRAFGTLAEVKMNRLGNDERYSPWTEFILTVACRGDHDAHIPLIYSAFIRSGHPIFSRVRWAIADSDLSEVAASLIVQKLGGAVPRDWFALWISVRRSQRIVADKMIHFELRSKSNWPIKSREMALEVLRFWCGLPAGEHSATSRAAAEAAKQEVPIEEIFAVKLAEIFAVKL